VVTAAGGAGRLRAAARIAGFGALTGAMLPVFVARQAVAGEAGRERVRRRWVGAWASGLLSLFGVSAIVAGEARSGDGRGRLVVANHRSTADILVLLRAFGGRMVSRADLSGWPLVGPAARAAGTLFVDRSDRLSGAAVVRQIRRQLAAGSTVIVFPEGTTFPDDEVRPFHPGAFVAAVNAEVAVVPVGLAYATGSGAAFVNESFPAHLKRMAAAAPSCVGVCIGAPIEPGPGDRAAHLRDLAHTEVQRLVHDARHLVDFGETEDQKIRRIEGSFSPPF
jgi:1-acyl-sn-glycerol-3-phosphate acyltransferase